MPSVAPDVTVDDAAVFPPPILKHFTYGSHKNLHNNKTDNCIHASVRNVFLNSVLLACYSTYDEFKLSLDSRPYCLTADYT